MEAQMKIVSSLFRGETPEQVTVENDRLVARCG
jgi:hypothetical protein